MISDADKKQTVDCFIENIARMSDKEYQERVWVRAEGPECDNIDENICHFFDEDYVLKKYKDFGITEIQYKSLMKLREKLDNFIDEHGVQDLAEKLINLPEWEEIRETSKNILKLFNY